MFVPEDQSRLTRFSGISGSAVHAIRSNAVGSEVTWLCGFVYEEGPGHTLMVAHADHINADGTIC